METEQESQSEALPAPDLATPEEASAGLAGDYPAAAPPVSVEPPPPARARFEPFLTPAAILVGALLVSAAILWSGRDDDSDSSAAVVGIPTAATTTESRLPEGGASGASAQTLRAALSTYAREVGADATRFDQCVGRGDTTLINRHFQRGQQAGVSGTPTFFINNKKIVGAQPAAVFDEVIAAELRGSPATIDNYSAAIKQLAQAGRFEIVPMRPDITDAPIEGKPGARVVIAEFSDFQCPFCKQWTDANVTRLRPQFGDDVALAFLHFPIQQIHPNAPYAHVAAVCAAEQGKFWPMHDLLFARQQEWSGLRVN